MKKVSLLTAICLLMAFLTQAQVDRDNFKAGLNAGLPLDDASDVSSFSLGLDLAYHIGVSRQFDLGIATGFTNAFGKTETVTEGPITIQADFENVQFVPLAGLFRFYPSYSSPINFGADVGYALGVSSGNSGGLYYRPIVAVSINDVTELTASYTGINLDGGSWNTATLGILFLF